MGFSFKNAFVVFMALWLLLASGCIASHGGSSGVENRRELRKAPSGPDPIHHSAAHPNNPRYATSPPTRY
ncbi:hypothetical protein ACET3Z_012462 [Daucus carota]